MNIVQLQDLLRGLPDDRLKMEMAQPTGTVPQYLVLSEIVRRDKMRQEAATAPKTTVAQDVLMAANAMPLPVQQEQPAPAYANGGFITPATAMGNSGVRGFAPEQPKQKLDFGFAPPGPQMFSPNMAPQPPAPVTNTNVNIQPPSIPLPQPQFDGGTNDGPNAPSYYEQPQGYAHGGVIALADGSYIDRLAGAESGMDPLAKNKRSSAGGLGQFLDSTWLAYLNATQPGLVDRIGRDAALKLKFNEDQSRNAIDWYANENKKVLASSGFEPTEGNLYLAHFLGGQGAKKVLSADPETPIASIVGEKVIKSNPFLKNMSAADVVEWSKKKIGEDAAPVKAAQPNAATDAVAMSPIMNPADRELGILSGGVMPKPRSNFGIADLIGREDTKAVANDLGAALIKQSQAEVEQPELPKMRAGDPSLVANIGAKSPDDIIAEYRALRQGYMANGGPVRMANGTPKEWPSQKADMEWRPPKKFDPEQSPQKDIFKDVREPEPKSALDLYSESVKSQQALLKKFYEDQIALEEKRQAETQGLPYLLRQLGLGMIAGGGNLSQGLRSGVQQALTSRDEQAQQARDRIRELQMKRDTAGIEGIGDLAKLQYDAAAASAKALADKMPGPKDFLAQSDEYGKMIADRSSKLEANGQDPSKDPYIQYWNQVQQDLLTKAGIDLPQPVSGTLVQGDDGKFYYQTTP